MLWNFTLNAFFLECEAEKNEYPEEIKYKIVLSLTDVNSKPERPSVDQKKLKKKWPPPRKIIKKKHFGKSFFYQKFGKGYRIYLFYFFLNFKNQYPFIFFSSQVSKEEIPFYHLLSFRG